MSKKTQPNRDNSQGILARLKDNEQLTCSCLGCLEKRYRFTKFCAPHYRRYNRYGDAHQRPPSTFENNLKLYRKRVGHFIWYTETNLDREFKVNNSGWRRASQEETKAILTALGKMRAILKTPKVVSYLTMTTKDVNYPLKDYRQEGFKLSPKMTTAINKGLFGREETILGNIVGTILFHRDYPELLLAGDALMVELAKSFLLLCRGVSSTTGSRVDKINLGLRLYAIFNELIATLTKTLEQSYIFNFHSEEEIEKKFYFKSLVKSAKTSKHLPIEILNSTHIALFDRPFKSGRHRLGIHQQNLQGAMQ